MGRLKTYYITRYDDCYLPSYCVIRADTAMRKLNAFMHYPNGVTVFTASALSFFLTLLNQIPPPF